MSEQAKSHLEWKDEYNVEVKEIDEQHKKLVTLMNELMDSIQSKPEKDEVHKIIENLVSFKKNHFETEEKYFEKFDYKGTEEHKKAHGDFDKKIRELKEKNAGDELTLAFELVDYLEDWFLSHLRDMDRKYMKCFHDNGLS